MSYYHAVIKHMGVACLALLLNEAFLYWMHARLLVSLWALLCLWILCDLSAIPDLHAQTQHDLQHQLKLNALLHEHNMTLTTQMLRKSENHQLLCEIRARMISHCARLKQHHTMACEHFGTQADMSRLATA